MQNPTSPYLDQNKVGVWMRELARSLGRPAALDEILEEKLDRIAGLGFDWVWFLGVWQTGPDGQRLSQSNREWRKEFQEALPDYLVHPTECYFRLPVTSLADCPWCLNQWLTDVGYECGGNDLQCRVQCLGLTPRQRNIPK